MVMALIVFNHGFGSSGAQRTARPGCQRRGKLGSATLMACQGLSARILANHGQDRDAEQLVRPAAALAAQTDLTSEQADTLLKALSSSPRQARSPNHIPPLPRRSASTSAKATCQGPVIAPLSCLIRICLKDTAHASAICH
jgi:hypothetical protein